MKIAWNFSTTKHYLERNGKAVAMNGYVHLIFLDLRAHYKGLWDLEVNIWSKNQIELLRNFINQSIHQFGKTEILMDLIVVVDMYHNFFKCLWLEEDIWRPNLPSDV
jgi:hypothetical protein